MPRDGKRVTFSRFVSLDLPKPASLVRRAEGNDLFVTHAHVRVASRLLTHSLEYETMSAAENPFGDGHAAERIVDIVEQRLCGLFNPQQSELAYASISSAAGD